MQGGIQCPFGVQLGEIMQLIMGLPVIIDLVIIRLSRFFSSGRIERSGFRIIQQRCGDPVPGLVGFFVSGKGQQLQRAVLTKQGGG